MILAWLLLLAQWTSANDRRDPRVLLQGWWRSCPEDGGYSERIFEYYVGGKPIWHLHMGSRDEFALFTGPAPERHVDHDDPRNLLRPSFHYGDVAARTGRNWSALGVHLNVIQVPGSTSDCYEYLVRVEQDPPPAWIRR